MNRITIAFLLAFGLLSFVFANNDVKANAEQAERTCGKENVKSVTDKGFTCEKGASKKSD